MFAGCCWWRSLAVDGYSGASRGHAPVVRRPSSWRGCADERPSVFQAGHIPSWRGSRERYELSPVAVACRWSLLLLSQLLSTQRKPSVAIGAAACRGWPASGPGRLRPGPWFLTGVSAEAPGSSMTSRVRSPGTFSCARCPAVTVMLEAGGADTYTSQAIPGSEPGPCSCTFRHRRHQPPRLAPARGADALHAALTRRARAAQAGRGLKHRGRPEPLGAGVRGRQPPGREAFEFAPDLLLRRSSARIRRAGPSQLGCHVGLAGVDRRFPRFTVRSGTQRARGYFGEHLIRRSGHIVQDRPMWSIRWADIPALSVGCRCCPPPWQQYWQQSRRGGPPDCPHGTGDGPRPVRAGSGLALWFLTGVSVEVSGIKRDFACT